MWREWSCTVNAANSGNSTAALRCAKYDSEKTLAIAHWRLGRNSYEALEAAVDDANGRTKALRAREKELQAQAELAEQKLRDSTQTHQAEVSALKQEIEGSKQRS